MANRVIAVRDALLARVRESRSWPSLLNSLATMPADPLSTVASLGTLGAAATDFGIGAQICRTTDGTPVGDWADPWPLVFYAPTAAQARRLPASEVRLFALRGTAATAETRSRDASALGWWDGTTLTLPGGHPHLHQAALEACAAALPTNAAVALARLEGAILRRVPTRTVAIRYVSCPTGQVGAGRKETRTTLTYTDGHGNAPPRGSSPRAVGTAHADTVGPVQDGYALGEETPTKPGEIVGTWQPLWTGTTQLTGRKVIQVTRTERARVTAPTEPDGVTVVETDRRPIIDCTHPWPDAWPVPTTTIEETLEWRTFPCPTVHAGHPLAVPAGSPQRQRRVIRLTTEAWPAHTGQPARMGRSPGPWRVWTDTCYFEATRTEAEQSSGTCAAGCTRSTTLERTRSYVARVYARHVADGRMTGMTEDRKPGAEGSWSAWTTVASSCTPIATSTGDGGGSDDDDDGNWPSPSTPSCCQVSAGPGGYNSGTGNYNNHPDF